MRVGPGWPRAAARAAAAFAATAALIPIANIIGIIAATGADNVANDYLAYIGLIDQVLAGSYPATHFVRDAFWNGHFLVFPVLSHVFVAYAANLNVYVEMYFGVALALVRACLLYNTLARPAAAGLAGWLALGLAALVFSTSQISTFTYGEASLVLQWMLFGFALGLWGLVRYPASWPGVAIGAAGSIVAAWSWGAGPAAWPLLALGCLVLG
jgi:hypothetical protein